MDPLIFLTQAPNEKTGGIDFSVAIRGRALNFHVARKDLENLERTSYRTAAEWMPAFERQKTRIRLAVEQLLAAGIPGRERVTLQLQPGR